ncbi:hypothetical protein [Lapillicoccus jejuensis]|uniref:Uncharacterized protein n=1 Tax=Lapillicoccus jejuensis TaxID=402171 RepID=A0A542E5S7_9MICO|nr:hypothetical protein [Lapillicoccus jejuensis]TQJ10690.1 hypothetical protein FB458_3819 [Lapillicoccus jejuensis]
MTAPTSAGGPGAHEERPVLEARTARRAAPPPLRPLTRRERREQDRWRRGAGRTGGPGAPRTARGRLAVLVVSTAVLSGLLLVLASWWGPSGASRPAPGDAAGAGAPVAVPAAASTEAPGRAVVAGVPPDTQGGASPGRVLQGLLDARAAALRARDPALLTRAERVGSSVQTADAALLRRLLAARQAYDGLGFAAHEVVVLSRTGDRLVLRARVARSAYELVGADGTRTPQAGSDGTAWRYVLERGTTGWRLAEVTGSG